MHSPLRLLATGLLALVLAAPVQAQQALELEVLGTFATGIFDESAAEIVDYDPATQRLYFVNSDAGQVQAVDISDPANPQLVLNIGGGGAAVTSVAVANGIVAVAAENDPATLSGRVFFYTLKGAPLGSVPVGALPDALAFSEDGRYLVVANEGEPSDDYGTDPVGSITILDLRFGISGLTKRTVGFDGLTEADLDESVRIFGPGASIAQDLEPESVTVKDGLAYVTLQENNAVAVVDVATATLIGVEGLGFKDFSLPGNGLDPSNEDGGINIANWPVFGMYQPDGIATFMVGGQTYIVTANEGDARDYDGFSEEERVGDLVLDPAAFPDAADLQLDENLGRLKITTATGDTDGDGDFDELYAYGGRSFSIWTLVGGELELVFDSGDDFEQITATRFPGFFNSDNDENTFDTRSDDKGPEPEGVAVGTIDGRIYAFIGLERVGGVVVYDVTDPANAEFVTYVNNRDFTGDPEAGTAGDLGPEGLVFIPAADSPNGRPLLAVSNEVSGTVTLYGIEHGFTLTILHHSDPESELLSSTVGGFGEVGGIARFGRVVKKLRRQGDIRTDGVLLLSSGDNFLAGPEFNASLENGAPYYDPVGLSSLGYDALAIGNHEFDFGPDVLAAFIASFEAVPEMDALPPFLSANLDVSPEPALAVLEEAGRIAESTLVERDGRKIGIVGATTPNLPFISSPRDVVVFEDVAAEVLDEVEALKAQGAEILILITHLQGIEEDVELIESFTEETGIDIVVAGGGDDLLANDDDLLIPGDEAEGEYPRVVTTAAGEEVLVVSTDGGYRYVGRLVVTFDALGMVTEVSDLSGPVRVAAADGPGLDAFILEAVTQPVAEYVEDLVNTIVAQTEVPLDGRRNAIRFEETNLGDLIADAYLWQADQLNEAFDAPEPDVALANGGGIRNDDVLPVGPISEFDTFDILPFSNFLTIVESVPAEQFKILLENAYSRVAEGDPGDGTGRFAQVAGFTVEVDPERQAIVIEDDMVTQEGERIRSVVLDDGTVLVQDGEVVNGAPAVDIATVDFTARGGDQYLFGDAELTILGVTYQQTLSNYLQEALNGLVTAAEYPEGGNGRILILDDGGIVTDAGDDALPQTFAFRGNYPNPFHGATTLSFDLPAEAEVAVRVYDVLGREVMALQPQVLTAGRKVLRLDGTGLAAGVYVYRLTATGPAGTDVATGRMLLAR